MSSFNITNEGLKELPIDERDFALGGVFGYAKIEDVPTTDFIVAEPLTIKDQKDTDYCAGFTVTEVSEDQEGTELLPEYQFFSAKRIAGKPEEWGVDLRSACKSAVKYGSLPLFASQEMSGKPRDFILDKKNWPYNSDSIASQYKKLTYFKVEGPYDTFDNIRCALWKHKSYKCTIVTGAKWRFAWINAEGGIIKEAKGDGFGHAFKIFGQKVIDGELFLVAQLSNGKQVGDNGLYYFNREVTNAEIGPYGIFMLTDVSKDDAEHYLSSPYTMNDSLFSRVFKIIINFFK